MPFYEYQCRACGAQVEVMQKINDAPLKKCPECAKKQLTRLISAPVFRLKGGGWYETDFKGDKDNQYRQFYLAFDYIKVYRAQPEPEFVYLSDARIPRVITGGMVRHDRKQIREKRDSILDDSDVLLPALDQRSSEETYYKYRGEEILKRSGLAYAIVRVAGFNEVSFGEASTIMLSTEPSLEAVSRSDVAQVCAQALLDPNALNKSFYMAKSVKAATSEDENISAKFSKIPMDA